MCIIILKDGLEGKLKTEKCAHHFLDENMRIKEEVVGGRKSLVLLLLGIEGGQGAGQQPYESRMQACTG